MGVGRGDVGRGVRLPIRAVFLVSASWKRPVEVAAVPDRCRQSPPDTPTLSPTEFVL